MLKGLGSLAHSPSGLGLARAAVRTVVLAAVLDSGLAAARAEPAHGIAMHGAPALAAGFEHLPYVNPNAPTGGTLKLGELGTFDSLNPFILKGVAPSGIREWVYQSLLARSADEPFTLYGLVARTVETPPDRSWVAFHLDPEARFSDGKPVTPEDVVHSWRLLKEKGQPYHRSHYGGVARAEVTAPGVVRFTFADAANREAPLLLGLMPILPRHLTPAETFGETSLEPPIGSGPYVVAKVDAGRAIVLRRNKDWWARDRAVVRGLYNFDEIRLEYFRDQSSLFEAFKSGEVDVRHEDDAGRWGEGYSFPAVADGRVIRAEMPTGLPAGMTALVFNTRRPLFADPRVRRALLLMLDFEWINASLYHGHYARTQSFFERSELSAFARAADPRERMLLAPFQARVKPEVMAGTHKLPSSDGSGRNRENLRQAFALLKEAGYVQEAGRLVHGETRQALAFEMMAGKRAEERLFQAYAEALKRVGIDVAIRNADSAQRWARLKSFDFDMIQWTWGSSLSPGNEQRNRWGSESADAPNALNFAGVKDAGVDAVIDALLEANERPDFVSAVRALDRLLISGDYVIPLYHARGTWVAWWAHLRQPSRRPVSGLSIDSWWSGR
ncbi:MAG: extracellular solute-binding protein [Hyphomicrobiaceae bacterium]|nr:extracellular solute-binding protein [Hyphomicrobiaceae bacterium]